MVAKETSVANAGALLVDNRSWSASTEEDLQSALRSAAILAILVAYLAEMGILIAKQEELRWDLCLAPILVFVGAAASLVYKDAYRRRAQGFVLSLAAASVLIGLVSPGDHVYWLFACVGTIAGVLLGPRYAVAAAALGSVVTIAASGWTDTLWDLAILWLVTAVVCSTVGVLMAMLKQARANEMEAWQRAGEARSRRGELARAQKSLGEAYDLLQRANHELAIARQEAEEARHIKAQFAANVSHELRTPLNLIIGFSDMMYHSPEVYGDIHWTVALREDVREIYRSARHLLSMVDDILDLSRIDAQRLPLKLELADLAGPIREAAMTARQLVRGKNVRLVDRVPDKLPQVLVDRGRIRQVLLNLLNNAVRFTDQGLIEVTAEVRDGEVRVAVSDTGVGIPQSEMRTIFEEFGQAKGAITNGRGGAGLGLAICRQLIRLHGGHIEAESEAGKGSTFRFAIPLPDSGQTYSRLSYYAPEGWSPPIPENPLGRTVIVYASEPEAGTALGRAILGYRVIPVHDLTALADRVEADHPAGLVIIAGPSSEGVDPAEIWQRTGRPDLPVIVCPLPKGGDAAQELGVARYLVKPVEREQLIAAVTEVCPAPKRILVVDDDPGFVTLTERFLQAEFAGVQVRRAYSGAQALSILAHEAFDLVLLDLIMPEVGGVQVIREIRRDARLAATSVVAVSGSGQGERATSLGMRRIELHTSGRSGTELGPYITSLLGVHPPDYSRLAPDAQPPASAAASPAS